MFINIYVYHCCKLAISVTKTGCNACEFANRRCVERNGNIGCCNRKCAGGCFASTDENSCYV